MGKPPKWIFTYSDGVVCCVKNRNLIALIFREIYRFNFYAIYINPKDPFSYRMNIIIFPVKQFTDIVLEMYKDS